MPLCINGLLIVNGEFRSLYNPEQLDIIRKIGVRLEFEFGWKGQLSLVHCGGKQSHGKKHT